MNSRKVEIEIVLLVIELVGVIAWMGLVVPKINNFYAVAGLSVIVGLVLASITYAVRNYFEEKHRQFDRYRRRLEDEIINILEGEKYGN